MKLGILVTTNDPELVWNVFRLAIFSLAEKDEVKIFFMSKGVEYDQIKHETFDVLKMAKDYLTLGGKLFACSTCMELRKKPYSDLLPMATLKDLHKILRECDKVLTF